MKTLFKNNTIRTFRLGITLMVVISLGIFMQGCSDEEEYLQSSEGFVDRENANLIASNYLELHDNQYILNLTKDEALKLKISNIDYDRIQEEILQTNAFIIECHNANIAVDVNDPKDSQVNAQKIRLKNLNEQNNNPDCFFTLPQGTLSGSASKFVPYGAIKLKITAAISCAAGSCSGSVKCCGIDIPFSITGVSGGSTTINLPCSNTGMTINASTLCSGGGSVSATFIY
jgi:hypothetical protein